MSAIVSVSELLDQSSKYRPATAEKEDSLVYDLGNLAAFDFAALQTEGEKALAESTRDNVQLLFNRIFALPTEPLPADFGQGRLATLPEPTTSLPREKPAPKLKTPTKWEEFAKLKGIQKRKRSKLLFDEASGDWKRRYGYDKANDETQQWVVEAKANDDGSVDPWTQMQVDKKERVAKNQKQQLRNLKAAEGARVPGTLDLSSTMAARGKRSQLQSGKGQKKRQHHVDVALGIAQHATASVGVFDSERYKEPKKKLLAQSRGKPPQSAKDENRQSLSVLANVLGPQSEAERFDFNKAANLSKAEADKGAKQAKLKKAVKKQKAAKATGRVKKKPKQWHA
eukprot:gb/GEZN01010118.1/.p1 GENE.gb/GEZN01010118.1/~~gb/GEZN01010118.1/.p1  ORF type:complete len:340 (+),score=77.65 gb/GEZN01010118.1/:81-1100(+)